MINGDKIKIEPNLETNDRAGGLLQTAAEAPLPWIYHIMLGILFPGVIFVKQVLFVSTQIAIPVSAIKVGILLLLAAMLLIGHRPRLEASTSMISCQILLAFYGVFGFLVGFFRSGDIVGYPLIKMLFVLLISLLGVWVVYRVLETRADLKRFAIVILFFALWICLTLLPELIQGDVLTLMGGEGEQQYGVFGLPIPSRMGIGMRLAPVILIPYVFTGQADSGLTRRFIVVIIAIVIMILLFTLVLVAGHRGALGGMILALIFRQFAVRRVRDLMIGAAVAVLFLILVGSFSTKYKDSIDRAKTMFNVQTRFTDMSARDRRRQYAVSFDLFLKHPVIGLGFGGYQKIRSISASQGIYPHNIILEYLTDIGLLGLFVLGWFLAMMARGFHGLRDNLTVGFAGMFIVSLFISLVSGNFLGNHNLYLMIGMLPLLEKMKREQADQEHG